MSFLPLIIFPDWTSQNYIKLHEGGKMYWEAKADNDGIDKYLCQGKLILVYMEWS